MNAYEKAMTIQTQERADQYFDELVKLCLSEKPDMSRTEAERIQRHNLGYFAGYYDHETRERVERVFHCAHPIFGAIASVGAPSIEDVLRMGMEMGKASRVKGD